MDFGRSTGTWQRRITMIGHDGSLHQFKVQNPAGRNSRREERVVQLFRIMNSGILYKMRAE